MTEKWVIANWKMNIGLMASAKLSKIIAKRYSDATWLSQIFKKENKVNVVVCPSYTAILEVAKFLQKTPIAIGAQNMFWQERGAYTGEISPLMLMEIGVDYVILGHSERRLYLDETDAIINKKIRAATHYGLTPVVCVGETADERACGQKEIVVRNQISLAMDSVKFSHESVIIIAYEPVWAIGTGNAVSPDDVFSMHSMIRQTLYEWYPQDVANDNFKIIYGGSVDSKNVVSYTRLSNVDGVLVGGSSLKSKEFLNIISEVRKS